ncbi:3-deoxy-7-phosphoheptulonate synthase [Thermodesulforhabdus norvegica]|uniref:3-deoxy-D-arabinoheptulosonate-7-phosphate synthase n=1 Tax=Thermodesulforhabdus norvegica TaxID=39841 RepID=A0A1I4T6Z2_9BACT|nr:3-deoxy-7-phosphoheptulonate synthase [Thermodesulforhabdus norvegica]SFM72415.1 3-deoxy-D-arabinoheptulosonate-7-phosphate synthase [Thermodesulforhabdus norvegica]
MILVLKKNVSDDEVSQLRKTLRSHGYMVREIQGVDETVLGVVGQIRHDSRYFETLPGVAKVMPVSKPYKLVSRDLHPEPSRIRIRDIVVGGDRLVVIAGPCSVENRERTLEIARIVKQHGATLFRGGAFKPRTSPYSFQGLGEEGLKILAEVREETGLGIVTEITSPAQADLMMKYVDVVQVGARNMQNFELLRCVGRMGKPVLLKRGLAATIEEWLMAAEYILSEGNEQVILCERGIRTFETYTRNTLDLTAVPVVKKLTHLPVIVDPSHATGIRDKVIPMARAAVAAGADGIMVEVHTEPDKALSDGPQSLYPEQFESLMRDLHVIAPVVGKQLDFDYIPKARYFSVSYPDLPPKILHAGVPGSFSHKAALQYFGEDAPIEQVPTFRNVFENVASGKAKWGIVPLENSLTGSIHANYDLLMEFDLFLVGELTLRIVHNLIGLDGAKIEDIKTVYSHPQVFEQCSEFLSGYPHWDLVACKDSATAVLRVQERQDPSAAAIASEEAARLFGMTIIKAGIETHPLNFTRFGVISAEKLENGPKDKSSIIFSVSNRPGALYEVLKIFAERQINMVKLESRPVHGRPWEYLFYADLEVDLELDEYRSVIEALRERTEFFRYLGSYRQGARIVA